MKVHCYLCGATLRGSGQFREFVLPGGGDVVHVCRDEDRCDARMACDPLTGRPPHSPRRSRETVQPTKVQGG